jgi:hypothetical protein
VPRLRTTRAAPLALLAALLACSDSDPGTVDRRSAPIRALEAIPLAGVLLAECASDGTAAFDPVPALGPIDPLGLIVLPPLDSVAGSDLGDLLVTLELHEDELPILAALVPAGDDPSLWVPLPLEGVLRTFGSIGIPLETPVLGSTAVRCDRAGNGGLGLVPLLAAAPA